MSINIITGFNSASRETLDKRSGPYDSVALAKAALGTNSRYVGLKVLIITNSTKDGAGNYIGGTLSNYIFKAGITDSDLVLNESATITVEDVLTSTSTVNALSANQGKVLKALVDTNTNKNSYPSADATKLAGIESGATADQTGAEIKTAYELENDTNAYTDSEKAKLSSIDATHYLPPLQNLTALVALTEASLTDKARIYVEDELSDYFYDATAVSGDATPSDQTNGTGFWKKVAVGGETAASIKTKYESNADTYAFTGADKNLIASNTNDIAANAIDISDNTTIIGSNASSLGNKVDKVAGKGLSANDFTTTLLNKLNSITAIFTTTLKTAYDTASTWVSTNGAAVLNHIANVTPNPHAVTKANVGLGNVDNTSDVNKPNSNATTTALAGKVDKIAGKGLSTEDFTTLLKAYVDNLNLGITSDSNGNLTLPNYPIGRSDGPIPTNKVFSTDSNGVLKLFDITIFSSPYVDTSNISSFIPNTVQTWNLVGDFFTADSIVTISGHTVSYVVYKTPKLLEVHFTSSASDGFYDLTIDNGISKTFKNQVQISSGTIFNSDANSWINIVNLNVDATGGLHMSDINLGTADKVQTLDFTKDFELNFRLALNPFYPTYVGGKQQKVTLFDTILGYKIIEFVFDGAAAIGNPYIYGHNQSYSQVVDNGNIGVSVIWRFRWISGVMYIYFNNVIKVTTTEIAAHNLTLKVSLTGIDITNVTYIEY